MIASCLKTPVTSKPMIENISNSRRRRRKQTTSNDATSESENKGHIKSNNIKKNQKRLIGKVPQGRM